MSDLNSIFIVGRLTADPTLKYTDKGTQMMTFNLANNQVSFDKQTQEFKQKAGFFNIVLFGKQCESLGNILKKGHRIGVNGKLQQDQYVSKNGEKRSSIKIVAQYIQYLDVKRTTEDVVN